MSCPGQMSPGGIPDFENCYASLMTPALLGYPGATIPDDKQYRLTALRNVPGSIRGPSYRESSARLIEACLRARGILYAPSRGTCTELVPNMGAGLSGQIVGTSGSIASTGIGALGTAGALSGAATFGIGAAVTVAVSAIEGIFQHHAQAVANEQRTICSVANFFNPLVKQIDAACASGQISADEAIVYMTQVCNQAISGLQTILQDCNAACYFVAVFKGHKDFANYFYPKISPVESISATAPGAAPDFFGTLPGGVNVSSGTSSSEGPAPPIRTLPGNTYAPAGPAPFGSVAPPLTVNNLLPGVNTPDYLNRGYNQQTGQSGQAADVPNTTNWVMIGAIAAVIAAFVAIIAVIR